MAMTPQSVSDIDRLAALARREPAVEAALLWTMVWVLVVFVLASVFPAYFFIGEALQLSRVTIAIIGGGVLAAGICAIYSRWTDSKVEAARTALQELKTKLNPNGR